jgi:hypothetical protein
LREQEIRRQVTDPTACASRIGGHATRIGFSVASVFMAFFPIDLAWSRHAG